jgi:hypothetical protein
MSSIQLKIWLERAGLITEDNKLENEIEDFLNHLRQHDGENDDGEHPDDVEDDEDAEDNGDDTENAKKQIKEEKKPKAVKEKTYSSNDKGVLHELLVGKHLLGKHMTLHKDKEGDSPEQAHDKIKAALYKKHGNHDEYNRLDAKAKSAAEHVRNHVEKNGHKVHDVHWTSKPGDIKKSTGIDSSQKEDASDIMIHTHNQKTKKKKFVGASLKVTDGKNKHITASNPGMEATHGAHHIVDKHRKELLKAHPQLVGVTSPEKRKEMMNDNPKMKADVVKRNHKATVDIAKHLHKHLASASKEDLVHHIKSHVLQANKTPLQHNGHEHIRHTTYQSSNKTGNKTLHDTSNPSEHWSDKLNDHKNITVHHDGKSGTIHFKHNGKTFASHRIRVASSSDPMTSFKGDGKAHE